MGIFDPDEVITVHSLRQAIEDGALVEVFKKRWKQLSDGKPIVASAHLVENVSHGTLRKIWNEFISWKKDVESALPEDEKLFSTEIDGQVVWVIEDAVAYTMMYPNDY